MLSAEMHQLAAVFCSLNADSRFFHIVLIKHTLLASIFEDFAVRKAFYHPETTMRPLTVVAAVLVPPDQMCSSWKPLHAGASVHFKSSPQRKEQQRKGVKSSK